MAHFGRRTLYLSGQALTFLFVLLIGTLACIPQHYTAIPVKRELHAERSAAGGVTGGPVNHHPTTLNWTIAALLLAFTLTYDATLGPICYSLVSEIPSTRLRSKTIVLARNCYNISGIVTNVITPRMLNPTAWGWGAKSGFFWAGTAVMGMLWSWWRLPEPKGMTFGELDECFERRLDARRFKIVRLEGVEAGKDE
jgi:SP family general alpha glucoside:H+ symporter-like MFS transporter